MSLLQKVRADSERFINAFINTVFSASVGVAFPIWYAATRHWLLVPVFLIGVLVLGGLTGLLRREIKSQQRSITRNQPQFATRAPPTTPCRMYRSQQSTVMQADTIFVLEKGRIVESGAHAALLEQKSLYYAMWRQQIGERPAARAGASA